MAVAIPIRMAATATCPLSQPWNISPIEKGLPSTTANAPL